MSCRIISSSNKSKNLNIFIQLCIYPDENYACRTMRILLSSHYYYSLNVCDEFGCNVFMYSLRYQRYRLFEFLLNETSVDINLREKDQYGNTIFHYAILYGGNNTKIIEKLIEKYNKFAIEIDERNNFGFTPLLLAGFCGRYDFVLTLLNKTDASPFVRDHIQLKNLFDYVEIDMKHRQCQNNQQSLDSNPELKRFRIQLYQTIPRRHETSFHKIQHKKYKNFFEIILFQAVQDQSGLLRSSIIELFDSKYLSSNLTHLLNYLNQRYPRIKTLQQRPKELQDIKTTKFVFQRENSKTDVHKILNLYDPNPRPKMAPPTPIPMSTTKTPIPMSTTKTPMTFKRLSVKITTLAAFSRITDDKKRPSLIATDTK